MNEVIAETDNFSESLAEADRLYRDAEDGVSLALARLRAATGEHRQAGAAWQHAMELRNQRLRERADVLATIHKQETEQ